MKYYFQVLFYKSNMIQYDIVLFHKLSIDMILFPSKSREYISFI